MGDRRIPHHCYLCGEPATDNYCNAHSWADGTEHPTEQPLVVTPLHEYWMAQYTPDEVIELATHIHTESKR